MYVFSHNPSTSLFDNNTTVNFFYNNTKVCKHLNSFLLLSSSSTVDEFIQIESYYKHWLWHWLLLFDMLFDLSL